MKDMRHVLVVVISLACSVKALAPAHRRLLPVPKYASRRFGPVKGGRPSRVVSVASSSADLEPTNEPTYDLYLEERIRELKAVRKDTAARLAAADLTLARLEKAQQQQQTSSSFSAYFFAS